jgi:hypothetical protein
MISTCLPSRRGRGGRHPVRRIRRIRGISKSVRGRVEDGRKLRGRGEEGEGR